MSGAVWMYRKGEARLFASPDRVPANEGWQDSPVDGEVAVKGYDIDADEERQRVVSEAQGEALEKSGVPVVKGKNA